MELQQPDLPEPQFEPILSLHSKGRRPPSFDALNKADIERLERRNKGPQRLKEIEEVIKQLIDLKEQNHGTLRGTGARNAAAIKLDVSVWTIDNYIEKYEADPRIESQIDKKRGRTPGGTFTPKQQAIICYYYINPEKQKTDSDGKLVTIPGLESTQFIQKVLQKKAPTPAHSDDAVRRFMRNINKDEPLIVALARKGEKYVYEKLLPARRNDVKLANERWQLDGRPLPLYIRHDNLVCTVTLLLLMDDLAQYPLRARLIPRQLRDEKGIPKRSDFTAADVGILVASAIHYSGVCHGALYNDNGSQIIAIEKFLNDLSSENQAVVLMTKSIPRFPRSRGKIENMLK